MINYKTDELSQQRNIIIEHNQQRCTKLFASLGPKRWARRERGADKAQKVQMDQFMHKRKHHRKPKVVRDPEQIKRLRQERLNVKRQIFWDARFVKETIPDILAPKPKWRKVDKTHKGRTPLESAYIEKEKPRFSDIQDKMRNTISTTKKKSFNIRQLRKEIDQPLKERALTQQKMAIVNKQVEKQKKISIKQKNKQKLISKLQQKVNIFAINDKYKHLLIDIIQKSTHKRHKSIRTIIQKEIQSIGNENNAYKKLQKLVQTRKTMLKDIKDSNQEIKLKTYIDFQMHSLTLIEQILKFKAFWEAIYFDNLKNPTKINFYYGQINYLSSISEEVRQFAEGDPFLVARTAKLYKRNEDSKQEQIRERKEMMLKIRACQLLLIEEELLATQ